MHNLIVLQALKYDEYIIYIHLSVPNSELSECIFLFFSVRLAREKPISQV